jgi:hypothetical protein
VLLSDQTAPANPLFKALVGLPPSQWADLSTAFLGNHKDCVAYVPQRDADWSFGDRATWS